MANGETCKYCGCQESDHNHFTMLSFEDKWSKKGKHKYSLGNCPGFVSDNPKQAKKNSK